MEYSNYEERLITFLMIEGGYSRIWAEQTVVDLRIEKYGDMHHQMTDENQRVYFTRNAVRLPANEEFDNRCRAVEAFRQAIGEEKWREYYGDKTDTRLLKLAIDDSHHAVKAFRQAIGEEKWRSYGGDVTDERLLELALRFSA